MADTVADCIPAHITRSGVFWLPPLTPARLPQSGDKEAILSGGSGWKLPLLPLHRTALSELQVQNKAHPAQLRTPCSIDAIYATYDDAARSRGDRFCDREGS